MKKHDIIKKLSFYLAVMDSIIEESKKSENLHYVPSKFRVHFSTAAEAISGYSPRNKAIQQAKKQFLEKLEECLQEIDTIHDFGTGKSDYEALHVLDLKLIYALNAFIAAIT